MPSLPVPRGPLSHALLDALVHDPHDLRLPAEPIPSDPLADEDLQLALYLCYELHYRGLPGVSDGWEWEPALLDANGGAKVDIVLEMTGGRVFDQSLRALAPFGRLVTYGQASRESNEISSGALMARSQAVIGFWLVHCFSRPQEMIAEPLRELFGLVASGDLRVIEGGEYGLSEARRAHEDMQARKTSGKLVLDPSR